MKDEDRIEFLVKWKNYGAADRTWENFEMFAYDAPDTVQEYLVKILSNKEEETGSSNKRSLKKKSGKFEEVKEEQEEMKEETSNDKKEVEMEEEDKTVKKRPSHRSIVLTPNTQIKIL